jgi:sulfite reductase (NADPH) flavoprotein alpha-component
MTLSIWRYAHLALAIISAAFLLIASVTGAILAFDAIQEKVPPYKIENFEQVTLAQAVPALKAKYDEVTEIDINYNGFVALKGIDKEGNEVDGYVNPLSGEYLGKTLVKSEFMQWVVAFHRSLFLKDPGRLLIGVVSFLLMLISISGLALILQRQRGLKLIFTKVIKEYFAQYYHIVTGRLMLIPVFIIALSGTYLSAVKFELFSTALAEHKEVTVDEDAALEKADVASFKLFKDTKLSAVKRVEFPFAEDPEEFFNIKLNDRALVVDQFSGEILSEVKYPYTVIVEQLSLDLHTGRTSIWWAVVLGIASLNILFFIYSGFAITLKRRETKIKNKFTANNAEFVFLVGTESGSTLKFANAIHQQLLKQGKASFLAQLSQYTLFPQAKHLVVFTSTYGLGEAPINGKNFLNLISENPQKQNVNCTVVGFGSQSYPDFCAFAKEVNQHLRDQSWATMLAPLHTVNDKSTEEFTEWVKVWNKHNGLELATTPAIYANKPTGLKQLMVLERTEVGADEHTFMLTIALPGRTRFTSGDLLAIYPADDDRERLYSVAKCNGHIQLVVKLHENGLGSSFLNQLKVGETFKGRIVKNQSFHLPKDKPVIMIGNGTGIAPFLGFVNQSKKYANSRLYIGFRNETSVVKRHINFLNHQIEDKKLRQFKVAYSREQNNCYVMDIIRKDGEKIARELREGAVVMICGSLLMQKDVEKTLDELCLAYNQVSLQTYMDRGQFKSDCY